MPPITCIEDLRQIARRKVPRANREDMERIRLRQRVLVDMAQREAHLLARDQHVPKLASVACALLRLAAVSPR